MISQDGDPKDLAETCLGKIYVDALHIETPKNWIYVGEHAGLDMRPVVIKVLKSRKDETRIKRFEDEVRALVRLNHPNITRIYTAGIVGGHPYLVLERIVGENLKELAERGRVRNLEQTLDLSDSMLTGLEFAQEKGFPHTDVKPENLMVREGEDSNCLVVDLGYWDKEDKSRNGSPGAAGVMKYLLENIVETEQKIPKKFIQLIEKAEAGSYEALGDFRKAFDGFRKWDMPRPILRVGPSMSRRRLLQCGGASIILVTTGIGLHEYIDRTQWSIAALKRKIRETPGDNFRRNAQLFVELGKRICNTEVRNLYTKKRIENGEYPYVTDESGNWITFKPSVVPAGFSIPTLQNAHSLTNDSYFADATEDMAKHIVFDAKKERSLNPCRFLFAGKCIPEAAAYFDDVFDDLWGFYDLSSIYASYFKNAGYHPANHRIFEINTLTTLLPLVLRASQLEKGDVSQKHLSNVLRHTNAVEQYLIRDDGSTRELALAKSVNGTVIEGRKRTHHEGGCFARGHAGAIGWFVTLYEATHNPHYFNVTEQLQNRYDRQLPEDGVPYVDLYYDGKINVPPEDFPRDTTAATKNCRTLARLTYNLNRNWFKNRLYKSLRSLLPYISENESSDVIISGGCDNVNTGDYTNSCFITSINELLEICIILKGGESL